ncbi:putative receptor-like protein 8 isoform X1 [Panicum virgatum]|uniref:putative receptor-like protein 8 isoform X1 n=1 Tax=Panicum virgatum TaxID=38727 RepID=UPI0019D67303|nr:putative receptor-like protein 8 isoform X1 [Panicum virgatum]
MAINCLVNLNFFCGSFLTCEIDPSICSLGVWLLDISNNISGSLPNCSQPIPLNFLNMSRNRFSGDIATSTMLSNAGITALDLSYNQFTGNIDWVHNLESVRYLQLGRNKFESQIPRDLCKLEYLRIIDLSHNRLSGSLPPCIGDLPFQGKSSDQPYWDLRCLRVFHHPAFSYTSCYEQSGFSFGTKWNLYNYRRDFSDRFFGFDLSENMLSGEIPPELGHLSSLKALNLSPNLFAGPIPAALANMSEIESLDLSHNQLSRAIPSELSRLSALAVFSVAYNDLSGCVSDAVKLGSFDARSYEGNRDLEVASRETGECTSGSGPDAPPPAGGSAGEEAGDPVLYAVSAASFVLSLWVTVGFIFCHPFGQRVILKL